MSTELSIAGSDQDLRPTVEELKRQLGEARDQQSATREVLRVVSISPSDTQPVFDAILSSAVRLLRGYSGAVTRIMGDQIELAALTSIDDAGDASLRALYPQSLQSGLSHAQAIRDRAPINITDAQTNPRVPEAARANARARGYRSSVTVPMLRHDEAVGTIAVTRRDPGGFTDDEIAVLQTFADQAVIAIENARLFNATKEALERQTATAEILKVIASSPSDVQPVFDAIVAVAPPLVGGLTCAVRLLEGDTLRVVAWTGWSKAEVAARGPSVRTGDDSRLARLVRDRQRAAFTDLENDENLTAEHRDELRKLGVRSALMVPLVRDGYVIGAISVARRVTGPFAEHECSLLQTFADQAVIAIENTRLFEEVQARTRELQESLEYQIATSDVLNVISRSPTDVERVFDMIAQRATRLCAGKFSRVYRFDGELLHLVSSQGLSRSPREPSPPGRRFAAARAIENNAIEQIPDIRMDPDYVAQAAIGSAEDFQSVVAVPMRKDGCPIGVIAVARSQAGYFPEPQVELLRTFADQAVIAIENTRLFEEVQTRTREATERSYEVTKALEQLTATSEVLGVISRSPTDAQPVFDEIAQSARRLCDGYRSAVYRFDGELIHHVAHDNWTAEGLDALERVYPRPASRETQIAQAILDSTVVHVPDIDASGVPSQSLTLARSLGYRSILAVPMLKDGNSVGAIAVVRAEASPFSESQIELLKTFADQAVIAIENARLFEAEQASKRELQEALEYQTATSDVLEVISRSPTDVQPVFEMIANSAARLCDAQFCHVFRFDGDLIHFAASHGHPAEAREAMRIKSNYPMRPGRGTAVARAISSGAIEEIANVNEDPEYEAGEIAAIINLSAIVAVPMLKDDNPIGAIAVARSQAGRFRPRQVDLLKTFADQAVIAIENTRLFEAEQASKRKLQESLEYQTAISDVLSTMSRAQFGLQPILEKIVQTAARMVEADKAAFRQRNGDVFNTVVMFGLSEAEHEAAERDDKGGPRGSLATLPLSARTAVETRKTSHITDIAERRPEFTQRFGTAIALSVPLIEREEVMGVLSFSRPRGAPFTSKQIELIETFADQAIIAIGNARLFEEVQARTRELAKTIEDLEIASAHKSQFVANMSHELRTPLAAILGYAELMQEGFYEPLGQKSLDALTRIRSNGKHLLGLINTVLDIAKIESGQFSLNLAEYAIESVVETVRAATESLAETKKLALKTDVATKLPIGIGDEQRLTQVLLNLVGNAIKFTDTGEVRIAATAVNGRFNVIVTDTGPGIPEEHQARIFEQFHQVDNSNTKAKGGTGLGLAIAKQIVEMHGGRIWVESTVGKGSSFRMELPTRAELRKATA